MQPATSKYPEARPVGWTAVRSGRIMLERVRSIGFDSALERPDRHDAVLSWRFSPARSRLGSSPCEAALAAARTELEGGVRLTP